MSTEIHSDLIKRHRQENQSKQRVCEWTGCNEEGLCKAPKSRQEIKTFRWFCKMHVRQYNLAWNYYAGMTDEEVENDVRRDTTWHRPSWKIGTMDASRIELRPENIFDPFKLFTKKHFHRKDIPPIYEAPLISKEQKMALGTFQLTLPTNAKSVKSKYKNLVKVYHPDANGNISKISKSHSEEKIKEINKAYKILINFLKQKIDN